MAWAWETEGRGTLRQECDCTGEGEVGREGGTDGDGRDISRLSSDSSTSVFVRGGQKELGSS